MECSEASVHRLNQKTTLAQFSLIHQYLPSWGQLSTTYTLHKGTPWFGAQGDATFNTQNINDENKDTLEFKKHTLDTNLNYYLKEPLANSITKSS